MIEPTQNEIGVFFLEFKGVNEVKICKIRDHFFL